MERPEQILSLLKQTYPGAKCALNHSSAWQLLLATILSAQCTDERVNLVTASLFAEYPTVESIDKLPKAKLKQIIRSTGFFNSKAKHIKGAARIIMEKHSGRVPDTMEELLELPGVARKTANVVLSVWFNKNEGVVVDTHVKRLSGRLGFTEQTDPVKVENDLRKIFPRSEWERISTLLIAHGRNICKARKPLCASCPLNTVCPSAFKV